MPPHDHPEGMIGRRMVPSSRSATIATMRRCCAASPASSAGVSIAGTGLTDAGPVDVVMFELMDMVGASSAQW